MQATMMGEKVVANAMSKIYANLNNGTHQQSANVNSTKSTTDMQSQSEVASRGGVGNSGTSGKWSSASHHEDQTKVSKESPYKKASELEVSEDGIDFIKGWEGFKSNPYRIKNEDGTLGEWTVGYGTEITQKEYDSGDFHNIDEARGDELLRTRGLPEAQRRMQSFIRTNNANIRMTQGQYDALFSLTYNTGYLGGNRFPKFQNHFKSNSYKGMIKETQDIGQLDGHRNRRRSERRMFLYNDYSGRP